MLYTRAEAGPPNITGQETEMWGAKCELDCEVDTFVADKALGADVVSLERAEDFGDPYVYHTEGEVPSSSRLSSWMTCMFRLQGPFQASWEPARLD